MQHIEIAFIVAKRKLLLCLTKPLGIILQKNMNKFALKMRSDRCGGGALLKTY